MNVSSSLVQRNTLPFLKSACLRMTTPLGQPRGSAAARLRQTLRMVQAGRPMAAAADNSEATPPAMAHTDARTGYMLPPPEMAAVVDAPPEPTLSFSPDRKMVLQLGRPPSNPPISELARPELKLAGLRIDPETFSRSRMSYYTDLMFTPFHDALVLPAPAADCHHPTGIPPGSWINYARWSPDSRHVALTLRSSAEGARGPLRLWTVDTESWRAREVFPGTRGLNTIFISYDWMDSDTIIAALIPEDHPTLPVKPATVGGPKIEDNSSGKKSQARTYPDLLASPYDEALFDHLGTSQLVSVKISTGAVTRLGPSRQYTGAHASPDGQYLLVSYFHRPYSYSVPCGRFPKSIELWSADGTPLRVIADLPLAEDIPVAFDSCRQGPRHLEWRDDKPAELAWIECQDGGDPAVAAEPRDIVYTLEAGDLEAEARPLVSTNLRCGGIVWGDDDLALLYESEWKSRRSIVSTFSPGSGGAAPQVLFDRNYEDAYTDPGSPALRRTRWSTYVLARLDGARRLLLQGSGAGPTGSRPFLDVLEVDSKATRRLWQSSPPFFETTSTILSDEDERTITLDGLRILATRESEREPPQFYIKSFANDGRDISERCISAFPHPYPTLKGLSQEIVRYKRDDGVELNATLYLPPGYDKDRDGPLPCLLWAYPREYKDKAAAGQLRRSPHHFSAVGASSPLIFLTRGWAVLDGPGFPIVAEGDEEPNDTFLEQLTASARAAVEEVVRRGVAHPSAVAIAGHSYGAFMAANLLAHAPDLFACGVGRSGAYNRTLTPFSFQQEQRTLWEVPETYLKMSPFMHADKVRRPLLLIHGADDNNTGTFTLQSERFYAALKGHGCVTRLVVLPHESHGYRARESVMHALYEMNAWLDRFCRSALEGQRGAAGMVAGEDRAGERKQGGAERSGGALVAAAAERDT
ncbi:hypothetical protein ACKKBF_B31065 [Auxenochlorella protothecoides x Auxenochlorella symbiontica]